jgi:hypothetical protein
MPASLIGTGGVVYSIMSMGDDGEIVDFELPPQKLPALEFAREDEESLSRVRPLDISVDRPALVNALFDSKPVNIQISPEQKTAKPSTSDDAKFEKMRKIVNALTEHTQYFAGSLAAEEQATALLKAMGNEGNLLLQHVTQGSIKKENGIFVIPLSTESIKSLSNVEPPLAVISDHIKNVEKINYGFIIGPRVEKDGPDGLIRQVASGVAGAFDSAITNIWGGRKNLNFILVLQTGQDDESGFDDFKSNQGFQEKLIRFLTDKKNNRTFTSSVSPGRMSKGINRILYGMALGMSSRDLMDFYLKGGLQLERAKM